MGRRLGASVASVAGLFAICAAVSYFCAASAAGESRLPLDRPAEAGPPNPYAFQVVPTDSLEPWHNVRRPRRDTQWFIDEGTLTNCDRCDDIGTRAEYRDFDLILEYKIVPGGNSGVFLRGRIELQILDSYGKAEPDDRDHGAIYGQTPPRVNASLPAGEWNHLAVRFQGDSLTAILNGEVIHHNVTLTKVCGGALRGGVLDPGPLMLQGDHGKVWFRNIRIRPLEPIMPGETRRQG